MGNYALSSGTLCLERIGLTSCMSNLWGNECLLKWKSGHPWEVKASVSLEDALADTLLAKHTKLARKQNQLQHTVFGEIFEVEQISPF